MTPKTKNILMWVCIVLLTFQFLSASAGKLTGAEGENFICWGYTSTVMYIIGTLALICAIGLLFPNFRKPAALGIIAIVISPPYRHPPLDETIRVIHNVILVLLAVGVMRLSKE